MADDRPALDPTEQLAALQKAFDDLRSTVLVRASRLPTGFVSEVLLPAALADTLILNGQTVSRATYPGLWKWVSDNALNGTGSGKPFGNGDGLTTFVLPDWRGRVLRGAAAGEGVGDLSGADSLALTTAQLPAHGHTFTTSTDPGHQHDFLTAQGGGHGGHFPASQSFLTPSGSTYGLSAWNDGGSVSPTHNHAGTTAYGGNHDHTGTTDDTGTGAAVDIRQASANVTYLIWT